MARSYRRQPHGTREEARAARLEAFGPDRTFGFIYGGLAMLKIQGPEHDIVGWLILEGHRDLMKCPCCGIGEFEHAPGCLLAAGIRFAGQEAANFAKMFDPKELGDKIVEAARAEVEGPIPPDEAPPRRKPRKPQ